MRMVNAPCLRLCCNVRSRTKQGCPAGSCRRGLRNTLGPQLTPPALPALAPDPGHAGVGSFIKPRGMPRFVRCRVFALCAMENDTTYANQVQARASLQNSSPWRILACVSPQRFAHVIATSFFKDCHSGRRPHGSPAVAGPGPARSQDRSL